MRWLKSLFVRRKPEPSPLEQARAARRKAAEAFADARARHDTRDEHRALLRLKRARHQELAAELER